MGTAAAGVGQRGIGFLLGASLGVLAWWAVEQARRAPPTRSPKKAVPEVPAEWQGVMLPGAGWMP